MFDLPSLIDRILGSNSPRDVLMASVAFLVTLMAVWAFRKAVMSRLAGVAKRTEGRIDDAVVQFLEEIGSLFYFAAALAVAAQFLVLPDAVAAVIRILLLVATTVEVVKLLQRVTGFLLRHKLLKIGRRDDENILQLMQILVNVVLWTTALLLILANMGVEIGSLIASLGIGGIAVALAVQNILGDVFNSFSIYLDRPFEVGDFIIVDPHMGTVKRIGLKTTRIQALSGEELVIPNSELTGARIQNFKKLRRRRVVFRFGVTYDTPREKLSALGPAIRTMIEGEEHATFDRAHFASFGDSSLDFEVVYYIEDAEYNTYMDTQQRINLAILAHTEHEGIDMAFPTRTVYLHGTGTSS